MLRRVKTKTIDGDNAAAIREAGAVIRGGGLVAFPTETVYGLGANALDAAAATRIFDAKGRPRDNPLIAHVVGVEMARLAAAEINAAASRLMDAFWPGGLTLLFPKTDAVPDAVTCGLPTVAIREPSNPIARALITAAGVPIAAPSANASGKPSPTRAEHVRQDLDGRVDIIIDGGACAVGLESTIVDVCDQPILLRPGAVPREAIERVLGAPLSEPPMTDKPPAPGMKYRHYAPNAPLVLIPPGDVEAIRKASGAVGVLARGAYAEAYRALGASVIVLGEAPEQAAARLFDALRQMDAVGVSVIFAESYTDEGLGEAVMNRLRKAASAQRR